LINSYDKKTGVAVYRYLVYSSTRFNNEFGITWDVSVNFWEYACVVKKKFTKNVFFKIALLLVYKYVPLTCEIH